MSNTHFIETKVFVQQKLPEYLLITLLSKKIVRWMYGPSYPPNDTNYRLHYLRVIFNHFWMDRYSMNLGRINNRLRGARRSLLVSKNSPLCCSSFPQNLYIIFLLPCTLRTGRYGKYLPSWPHNPLSNPPLLN